MDINFFLDNGFNPFSDIDSFYHYPPDGSYIHRGYHRYMPPGVSTFTTEFPDGGNLSLSYKMKSKKTVYTDTPPLSLLYDQYTVSDYMPDRLAQPFGYERFVPEGNCTRPLKKLPTKRRYLLRQWLKEQKGFDPVQFTKQTGFPLDGASIPTLNFCNSSRIAETCVFRLIRTLVGPEPTVATPLSKRVVPSGCTRPSLTKDVFDMHTLMQRLFSMRQFHRDCRRLRRAHKQRVIEEKSSDVRSPSTQLRLPLVFKRLDRVKMRRRSHERHLVRYLRNVWRKVQTRSRPPWITDAGLYDFDYDKLVPCRRVRRVGCHQ